jgi:GNAT superfamily N-acetyltransferase
MNFKFRLVTSRSELQSLAPFYERDLTALAINVNPFASSVTIEMLDKFFDHGGVLVCALREDEIVATASVVYVFKFNGCSARLEYVSTLPIYQGRGIGKMLITMLITNVIETGKAKFIDLTCEPGRLEANRLYEKLGFEIRQTNPRRLKLQSGSKRS